MFVKYAIKCSKNPRVKDKWLPLNTQDAYDTRNKEKYKEDVCKTERLKNSPIFQIRKRMNALKD